jgi:hypothetical protein
MSASRAGSWGELLQDALRGEPDKVPKGWQTAPEIAIEIGKSVCHARAMLAKRVAQGKVERRKFRIFTDGGGRVVSITHYRKK